MNVGSLIGQSPAAFLLASILIILAPGPDMALVARNTISRGRGAGFVTAGGAMAGVSVHVAAAVAGLSAVLTSSAYAFSIVKVVGAAYLLYLGSRTLLASRHTARQDDLNAEAEIFGETSTRLVLAPSFQALQGMLSAVLNPKLAVFFLTFLPQFVNPHHAPEASMIAHGAVFIAIACIWMTVWVLTLDGLSGVFRRSQVRAWVERATGAVLIGMGVRLALAQR